MWVGGDGGLLPVSIYLPIRGVLPSNVSSEQGGQEATQARQAHSHSATTHRCCRRREGGESGSRCQLAALRSSPVLGRVCRRPSSSRADIHQLGPVTRPCSVLRTIRRRHCCRPFHAQPATSVRRGISARLVRSCSARAARIVWPPSGPPRMELHTAKLGFG